MPINSREKGARREREACEFLKKHEIFARRSQQYKGTSDSPDIEGEHGEDFFRVFQMEIKGRETFRLYPWLDKCKEECGEDEAKSKYPCLMYKKNGKPWTITMYAEDLLPILRKYTYGY